MEAVTKLSDNWKPIEEKSFDIPVDIGPEAHGRILEFGAMFTNNSREWKYEDGSSAGCCYWCYLLEPGISYCDPLVRENGGYKRDCDCDSGNKPGDECYITFEVFNEGYQPGYFRVRVVQEWDGQEFIYEEGEWGHGGRTINHYFTFPDTQCIIHVYVERLE